jgi:hypothetical protein
MGTHSELKRNWGEMKKILPPLSPNLKGKKKHIKCMFGPSHGLHEISFPKKVCDHFGRN